MSDIRLSIAIMAVPQRRAYVATLAGRLVQQIRNAGLQGYTVTGPFLTVDEALEGPWTGWKAAWATRPEFATHHAVLQDDTMVCADFPQTLCRLIAARPTDFISGFQRTTRDRVQKVAAASSVLWTSERVFLGAICVVMPVALGDRAMKWQAPDPKKHPRSADSRLQEFLLAERRLAYIPVPYPANHASVFIGGSTLGHNTKAGDPAPDTVFWGEDTHLSGLPWEQKGVLS